MESVHMFYHAKMKWKVTESMFVLTRKNMLKCIHTSEQSLHPMLSTPTHLITRLYKMHCWARHTYLLLSLHSWNTSFLSLCVTVYAFVTTLSIHLSISLCFWNFLLSLHLWSIHLSLCSWHFSFSSLLTCLSFSLFDVLTTFVSFFCFVSLILYIKFV